MKTLTLFGVASVGVIGALPSIAAQCSPIDNVKFTYYGWPDNGPPPGPGIAVGCGWDMAGGEPPVS